MRDGEELQSDDVVARREAARMMGRAKTEKKSAASRANMEKLNIQRKGQAFSEEHKEKLKAAQAARRERERIAKSVVMPEADVAPKRPRGRPRKSEGPQNTVVMDKDSETGT